MELTPAMAALKFCYCNPERSLIERANCGHKEKRKPRSPDPPVGGGKPRRPRFASRQDFQVRSRSLRLAQLPRRQKHLVLVLPAKFPLRRALFRERLNRDGLVLYHIDHRIEHCEAQNVLHAFDGFGQLHNSALA